MLTRAAEHVADHAKRFVKLELELAKTEIKRKVAAIGLGVALLVVAGVLVLFGLGFLLASAAAAIATALSTWLALLIVGGALVLLAATLALAGVGSLKRGAPPVPERALEEARLTAEVLKNGEG